LNRLGVGCFNTFVPPPNAEHARWFAEEVRPHEAGIRAWLRLRFPALNDVDDVIHDAYIRLFRAKTPMGSSLCHRLPGHSAE
jgi:hypothetical protein